MKFYYIVLVIIFIALVVFVWILFGEKIYRNNNCFYTPNSGKEDIDKDKIVDECDECPYDIGTLESNGCPDKIIRKSGIIEEEVYIEVEVDKLDHNTTEMFIENLPEGASFMDEGNGKGIFDWTPTVYQSGGYEIYLHATDSEDRREIQLIELYVECDQVKCYEDNMSPVL